MKIKLFKGFKDRVGKAGSVRNRLRLIFFIGIFFIVHDAQAQRKWDGNAPFWIAGVCGKLRFSAGDKFNMHPPYHIKYIVKHTIYTYTSEKLSSNKGEASYAIFPDDFIDGKGEKAHLSLSCVSDKISYEIYGDDTRIESGEVSVNYKVHYSIN
jgi:hypothetical protein